MFWVVNGMNERIRQLEERARIDEETKRAQIDQLLNNTKELNQIIKYMKENESMLLLQLARVHPPELHSQVLHWNTTNIPAGENVAGFVDEWTPRQNISVVRIQVWMGNPSNTTWEGDTYVVRNRSDLTAPDSLLVHYQFDKHAESPIPHQLMFDLEPGFKVAEGEKLSVWRLFVNNSPNATTAGDGEVIIYYVYV